MSSSVSWDTLRPVPPSPDFQEGATGASWPLMDFSFRNSLVCLFFPLSELLSTQHGAGRGGAEKSQLGKS